MNHTDANTRLKALKAGKEARGSRLDRWLAMSLAPAVSRNQVQALIRLGAVMLDGVAVTEPRRKLSDGENYEVRLPEAGPQGPRGEDIPLEILYEDDQLLVINKPAGLVVHPAPGNGNGTLVNALIQHCGASLSTIGGPLRPGIVHRLDQGTSGVMVIAKSDDTHNTLSEVFARRGCESDLERAYLALVWGVPKRLTGTIDAPLGRSTRDRTLRAVVPEGRCDARVAVTHYAVRQHYGRDPSQGHIASLLECRLETGRTHQIRVHMAHIGHPLVGDPSYGRGFRSKINTLSGPIAEKTAAFRRQALHARLLAFPHPETGIKMRFEADIPADMKELLEQFSSL